MTFGDIASTLNGNVGRGLTIVLSTKEGGTAKKSLGTTVQLRLILSKLLVQTIPAFSVKKKGSVVQLRLMQWGVCVCMV